MRTRMALLALFGVASTLAIQGPVAAQRAPEPDYTIFNPPLPAISVGGQLSSVLQGELRGAGYIIEVPPNWNGELVM